MHPRWIINFWKHWCKIIINWVNVPTAPQGFPTGNRGVNFSAYWSATWRRGYTTPAVPFGYLPPNNLNHPSNHGNLLWYVLPFHTDVLQFPQKVQELDCDSSKKPIGGPIIPPSPGRLQFSRHHVRRSFGVIDFPRFLLYRHDHQRNGLSTLWRNQNSQ